jgi:hypothetical protein
MLGGTYLSDLQRYVDNKPEVMLLKWVPPSSNTARSLPYWSVGVPRCSGASRRTGWLTRSLRQVGKPASDLASRKALNARTCDLRTLRKRAILPAGGLAEIRHRWRIAARVSGNNPIPTESRVSKTTASLYQVCHFAALMILVTVPRMLYLVRLYASHSQNDFGLADSLRSSQCNVRYNQRQRLGP